MPIIERLLEVNGLSELFDCFEDLRVAVVNQGNELLLVSKLQVPHHVTNKLFQSIHYFA